ncbi:MAG TPA: hypothetical protein VNT54_10815 [Solirubrobacteraceae bacterium]|nr:hypothetical protein [Solirubrobacteraceae bacterium]
MTDHDDPSATLTDEEIETHRMGSSPAASVDDGDDTSDTGDVSDAGDSGDVSDTGDDAGDDS